MKLTIRSTCEAAEIDGERVRRWPGTTADGKGVEVYVVEGPRAADGTPTVATFQQGDLRLLAPGWIIAPAVLVPSAALGAGPTSGPGSPAVPNWW